MANVKGKASIRRAYGYGLHISLHCYEAQPLNEVLTHISEYVRTHYEGKVSVNLQNYFAEKPDATEANLLAFKLYHGLTPIIKEDTTKVEEEGDESDE